MDLIEELLGLVAALHAGRIDYAVCGGIALAIHGHPRFTQDIDLLVQAADRERLVGVARTCGFTLEGIPLRFGAGTPNEREMTRLTKVDGRDHLTLDLLFAGRALGRVWATRQPVEWRGRELWVVSRDGLVEMKRISGRTQDAVDIETLTRDPKREANG